MSPGTFSHEDLLDLFAGTGHGHGESHDLGHLFDSLLQPAPRLISHSLRQRRSPKGGVVDLEDLLSSMQADWLPEGLGTASIMHADDVADLFPAHVVINMDPSPVAFSGFHDSILDDMMQHLSRTFRQDMLPALHRATGKSGFAKSCDDDVRSRCGETDSQLHCLGQHAGNVSEACRKDAGKSVPFLCSGAIDKWCNILERGILPCLADHLEELDNTCRDAVLATHTVIAKANTQKVSLVDPITGEKQSHSPLPPPKEHEIMESEAELVVPDIATERSLTPTSAGASTEAMSADRRTLGMGSTGQACVAFSLVLLGAYGFKANRDTQSKSSPGRNHLLLDEDNGLRML